jgi:hypothetical protein
MSGAPQEPRVAGEHQQHRDADDQVGHVSHGFLLPRMKRWDAPIRPQGSIGGRPGRRKESIKVVWQALQARRRPLPADERQRLDRSS